MKLGLIQMKPSTLPKDNIAKAIEFIKEAKTLGADLVVLPEIFICPYTNRAIKENAIEENHAFLMELKEVAKMLNLYLVAGSVPEKSENKVYNTSYVFDSQGQTIAKHRKIHLFDIHIEGGQHFMESKVLTAGNNLTTFETPWGTLGLMICYDIRFPELARLLTLKGAQGIIVPAAFNMSTGPSHWELTFRARALDNQVFMAGVGVARDSQAPYTAWGHSISTDPWGNILVQLDEKENIAIVEWDMAQVDSIRQQLPLLKHRRTDLYEIINPTQNN